MIRYHLRAQPNRPINLIKSILSIEKKLSLLNQQLNKQKNKVTSV